MSLIKRNWPKLSVIILFVLLIGLLIKQPQAQNRDPQITSTDQPVATTAETTLDWQDIPSEYHLVINKIKVDVPVLLNVPGANKQSYLAALHEGVAQYQGTALPGEVGNVVIFGHSATHPSKRGPYSQVFNGLDQLVTGDKIEFVGQDEQHPSLTYSVLEQQTISPKNTDVIKQGNERRLTLITCWPPGNIRHRLVVTAQLETID